MLGAIPIHTNCFLIVSLLKHNSKTFSAELDDAVPACRASLPPAASVRSQWQFARLERGRSKIGHGRHDGVAHAEGTGINAEQGNMDKGPGPVMEEEIVSAPGSAPARMRCLTISAWPMLAAQCKAVCLHSNPPVKAPR